MRDMLCVRAWIRLLGRKHSFNGMKEGGDASLHGEGCGPCDPPASACSESPDNASPERRPGPGKNTPPSSPDSAL